MRRIFTTGLMFLAAGLFVTGEIDSADTAVSPFIGPVISASRDFNNEKTKTSTGFGIGFDAFYRLSCGGCQRLSLMMSGAYTAPGTYNFGTIRRKTTGHSGIYQKKESGFNWNVGIHWASKPVGRVKFNLFAAPGIYFTRLKSQSFRDGNNRDLPLPGQSQNKIRFGAVLGGGPEVMLSGRTSVGIHPRFHVNLADPTGNFMFQIPVNFKFYF